MITKNQLLISCIFNGGNLIFLIYYIYDIIVRYTDLEHITRWSYYLNSIFTLICLYCDIFQYLSQKDDNNIQSQMNYDLMIDDKSKDNKNILQKINDWNRNKFGVICNSLCYFVSIGFWSLFILGNSFMQVSKSIKNLFNCIYHHCIIQIIVIVDIFAFERKIHTFSWFYFGIIYSIFIIYSIIIYIEKFYFYRNAYIFMKGSSLLFLLFCLIIGSGFLLLSYLIHIYLIEFKYKKIYKEKNLLLNDEENDKDFVDEE